MDKDSLARAAAVAGRQYGHVTLDQALQAGLTLAAVRRLRAEGHWVRVSKGVYRIVGVTPTWRGRMRAACLQGGDEAVISHRSAAAVWGLEGFEPPRIVDVSVPASRRPRIDGARVHRRDVARRAVRDGIPVTPIPETILDLCAVSRNEGIPLRALDDVRRRKLVSGAELERCAAEHTPRKSAGIPLYRALLERRLGRTPPGTVFAAEVLDLLVAAGLPEPEAEFWVTIRGRRYRIDLAYPRAKIAIECLGKIGHLNERSFEEDPVRNNDLALDGWLQIQLTYRRRADEPGAVVADVEAALARRAAA
ncbi:MAG TPA: type IV toxin-antitoxin system AbiEi family antitoxin domain-containing protein [Acidimicrobiia bacterium]|nr:type IV toxin-antitoxin system AbiEi family antitoxin domain-containing protein [Acidimicrobiia bacterium]HZQ75942.1 type IV toxin-antitoxin system AbiEi family antitoxin domain-containing protein [Acidimicrobiia bacterium]